jgi:hypothetical protein
MIWIHQTLSYKIKKKKFKNFFVKPCGRPFYLKNNKIKLLAILENPFTKARTVHAVYIRLA